MSVQPEAATQPTTLRICGGTARSRLWNQIKCDVVSLPATVPVEVDTGMIGAAMLAAVVLENGSFDDVRMRLAPELERLEPDQSRADLYTRLFDAYVQLSATLSEAFILREHDLELSSCAK